MSRRGFTLVEVLVAAFILTTAGLVVAGLYTRTMMKVRRSVAEVDAAMLAEAVRVWAPANVEHDTETLSHNVDLSALQTMRPGLLWKLEVDDTPVQGTVDVYKAVLRVAQDDDGDGVFDDGDLANAEVATFVFLLKDE